MTVTEERTPHTTQLQSSGNGQESAEVVRAKAVMLLAPLKKCLSDAHDKIDDVVPKGTHKAFSQRLQKVREVPSFAAEIPSKKDS